VRAEEAHQEWDYIQWIKEANLATTTSERNVTTHFQGVYAKHLLWDNT